MNRKDVEYVLSKMGVEGPFKISGAWLMMACPLARWTHEKGVDRNPSFGVRIGPGVSGANCFSCEFKGGLMSLVTEYAMYAVPEGLWTPEDAQQLKDFIIMSELDDYNAETYVRPEAVIDMTIEQYLNKPHGYMEERGLGSMAALYQLGFVDYFYDAHNKTVLKSRVLFPLYAEEQGRLVMKGVLGRTTIGEDPKYKNYPPNLVKAHYLYGGWLLAGRKHIVVVEGPVDSIRVNQILMRHERFEDYWAVSLMGAKPSPEQIQWLRDNADEVICMTDHDPSGRLGTKMLIDSLEDHLLVSVVEYPDGVNDPDDAGEAVVAMLDNRLTILEYRMRRLLGNLV